jgi:hypothetical protein
MNADARGKEAAGATPLDASGLEAEAGPIFENFLRDPAECKEKDLGGFGTRNRGFARGRRSWRTGLTAGTHQPYAARGLRNAAQRQAGAPGETAPYSMR